MTALIWRSRDAACTLQRAHVIRVHPVRPFQSVGAGHTFRPLGARLLDGTIPAACCQQNTPTVVFFFAECGPGKSSTSVLLFSLCFHSLAESEGGLVARGSGRDRRGPFTELPLKAHITASVAGVSTL